MNTKQSNSSYYSNFQTHINGVENSHLQSTIQPEVAEKSYIAEKLWLKRIEEMEELNANLERLIELGAKNLNDRIDSNSKFISIIAHDLRSPFISLLSTLDIAMESINEGNLEEIKEYINVSSNSATRTLSLLDNLLAWTASQNKAKNFNPVYTNIKELIEYEFESIYLIARQKQIALKQYVTNDLYIKLDQQMFKTILRNLINNSVKYTRAGGEIAISAKTDSSNVKITVKDNGIGIPHEVQDKLFNTNNYYTSEGTNNEKGTGLGLLLCKDFVEIHGGNINIISEPGNGCEFNFTLPNNCQNNFN